MSFEIGTLHTLAVSALSLTHGDENLRKAQTEDPAFNDLVQSIRVNGLITPLQVAVDPESGSLEVLDGTQRYAACMSIDPEMVIPVVIKPWAELADRLTLQIAANRNVPTKPIQFAKALVAINAANDNSLTEQELSEKTGQPVSFVRNCLKINKLGTSTKELVDAGQIKVASALELLRLQKHAPDEVENFHTDAITLSAADLAARITSFLDATKSAKAAPNSDFVPTAKARSTAEIVAGASDSNVIAALAARVTTIEGAIAIGILWAAQFDVVSQEAAKARWDAAVKDKAAKAEERKIQMAAKKAVQAGAVLDALPEEERKRILQEANAALAEIAS